MTLRGVRGASPSPPERAVRPVVALFGPTASGKTATAVALAERGARRGRRRRLRWACTPACRSLTAQPTAAERARAPHRLVGVWPLDHEGSVGEYAALAHAAIDDAAERGSARVLPAAAASTCAPRSSTCAAARVAPERGAPASSSTTSRGARRAHAELARVDPARRRGDPPERPPPRRTRPRARAQRLEPAPDVDRLWSDGMRRPAVFALDWPRDELTRADRGRAPTRCSPAARSTRCARCARRPRAVGDGGADPRARASAHSSGPATLDEAAAEIGSAPAVRAAPGGWPVGSRRPSARGRGRPRAERRAYPGG